MAESTQPHRTPEHERLRQQQGGRANWYAWGPYLSERQWGTVREDYSANGDAWHFFPHDHARSRVYRWGEDGLAGLCDEGQTLCFALALWNGQDAILKERLFGLTNAEGNHGEDVKELYYYLDNTPTHSYQKWLYKYPQAPFPYAQLVEENARRSQQEPEFELLDTGLFDEGRYFDVFVEYAKAAPEDVLIRITVHNRGPEAAPLTVLPTLWFRNRWAFGLEPDRPVIRRLEPKSEAYHAVRAEHGRLGAYTLCFAPAERVLMTENESNTERLFGEPNRSPFVKDAFHGAVTSGPFAPFDAQPEGTKCAPVYERTIDAGESVEIRLRLCREPGENPLAEEFETVFADRQREADEFYAEVTKDDPPHWVPVKRVAWAGLLWSKQYYHYDVARWLRGDPGLPPPPDERLQGRNAEWTHLKAEDILLVPDKWEYPWFASWDLAFHAIALCPIDLAFAKTQLLMLSSDRYRTPEGQIPAYEWNLSDNNPPVEAPAAWHLYRFEKNRTGQGDLHFLRTVFDRLRDNFNWWTTQKDQQQNGVFEGGFLGLDNVSLFDRSADIPGGGILEQADGTSWMAMYSLFLMQIALELAPTLPEYEEAAIKLFTQYTRIADAMQDIARNWIDDPKTDRGFFYDVLLLPDGRQVPLELRSMVGLSALFSVYAVRRSTLEGVPRFYETVREFIRSRPVEAPCYLVVEDDPDQSHLLFSLLTCEQIDNLLPYLFGEDELLGPSGIRSLSKAYGGEGYSVTIAETDFHIRYTPGESDTRLYGGNSNWRGPVWLPMNHILMYALRRFGYYYDKKQVEVPIGSGEPVGLFRASELLGDRMISPQVPDTKGRRPVHGDVALYHTDPYFRDLILFYEHYDGDTGRGLGASHQTGWSALVTLL